MPGGRSSCSLGGLLRVTGRGLAAVRPTEDRRELRAAVAGHEIAAAEPGAEDVGESAEDGVARLVAVLLVDRSEVVEVEQDRGGPIAIGQGTSHPARLHP